MSTEAKFQEAAENAKKLTKRPSDDELLELYALYKQATVGDNDTAKPGMLDLKGKAKWEAWSNKKGVSKQAAMEAYIELVEKLKAEYAWPPAADMYLIQGEKSENIHNRKAFSGLISVYTFILSQHNNIKIK